MKKTIISIIILALTIFSSPVSSVAASKNPLSGAGFLHFKEIKAAPDFILKDVEDNFVNLSKLQGKTILLFFWTSW